MTPADTLLKYHEAARQNMEQIAYNSFRPMLVLIGENGIVPIVIGGELPGALHLVVGSLLAELAVVAPQLEINAGAIKALAIHSDSYVKTDVDAEDIGSYRSGDLGELFAQGVRGIGEALRSYLVTPQETLVVMQPYRYTPVDGWEWGEPDTAVSDGAGHYSWDALWG